MKLLIYSNLSTTTKQKQNKKKRKRKSKRPKVYETTQTFNKDISSMLCLPAKQSWKKVTILTNMFGTLDDLMSSPARAKMIFWRGFRNDILFVIIANQI